MKELNKLILRYKKGDNAAFEKIVEESMPLVSLIAKKYKQIFPTADINELISEGTYGLIQGIKHYKHYKKRNFSTYIQFWIKKYIQKYIVENSTLIKVPHNVLKNLKKITNIIIKKNEQVSFKELSKQLNLDIDKIKELLSERMKTKKELQLDRYLDEYEQEETFYEIIPDNRQPSLEELIHHDEIKNYVNQLLDKLTYEEKEVIKWRFGLKDYKHHTLKDVAKRLGIPPHKVKQLQEVALLKLKKLTDKDDENFSS